MTTQHTPGPWYVAGQSDGNYIRVATRYNTHRTVARVMWGKANEPWPTDAADANLIAAAPDLLAALRAILEHPRTDNRSVVFMPEEVIMGLTAIAKAEGRS